MNDATRTNADPYAAIGVRPFINLCSVRTVHGGSLMLPQVRAAMAEASRAVLAGFELGTGVGLNIVDPEQAAAELRD